MACRAWSISNYGIQSTNMTASLPILDDFILPTAQKPRSLDSGSRPPWPGPCYSVLLYCAFLSPDSMLCQCSTVGNSPQTPPHPQPHTRGCFLPKAVPLLMLFSPLSVPSHLSCLALILLPKFLQLSPPPGRLPCCPNLSHVSLAYPEFYNMYIIILRLSIFHVYSFLTEWNTTSLMQELNLGKLCPPHTHTPCTAQSEALSKYSNTISWIASSPWIQAVFCEQAYPQLHIVSWKIFP